MKLVQTRFATLMLLMLTAVVGAEEKKEGEGKWYSLFDGRTLMGWQANSDHPESFSVDEGAIKVNGPVCHMFYVGVVEDAKFQDFEFKAKVKNLPKANSGIYFHTEYQESGWPSKGFEAQVNITHGDTKKTGGLYGVDDVTADELQETGVEDGEWYDYYIKVQGKHVIVKINDKQVVDYTQPEKPDHLKEFPGRVLGTGTFCLQAHDPGSTVYFKDLMVRPL